MNKITPKKLRELDNSLPKGAECYLCNTVRNALAKYRKGKLSSVFMSKDHALPLLAKNLGRGLKRFLQDDIRSALAHTHNKPNRAM